MRLLHLSDIHFREPNCLRPKTDPDSVFRRLLIQDLVEQCESDGRAVDAILVGGDIAYKANALEYKTAEAWLLDLASQCGCSPQQIYVVPGNHDVDRSICTKSQSVQNAQEAIARENNRGQRERIFRAQLHDPETGSALFQPLSAYNNFAAKFSCNVFASDPFWTHELSLSGVKLCIYGLTSTLLSGLGDRDAAPGRLYLSPLQTAFDLQLNTVNLVICHHPPEWLFDNDQVNDAVINRAAIQLFGHKHRLRCLRTPEYIRFYAGAVNPERDEDEWRPGYNILDLAIIGEGEHRQVEVTAHLRQLQEAPEMFVPLLSPDRNAVWVHRIPCKERKPLKAQVNGTLALTEIRAEGGHSQTVETLIEATPISASAELDVSKPSTKDLVYRFWRLSVSEKRTLALDLKLITKDDLTLPEPERYARALKNAADRGLVEQLAEKIEQLERRRN